MSDAGTTTMTATETTTTPWYDGLDTELKGHVQRTGWDKLDAAAAAAAAAKSHREAELGFQKALNMPRDELVRVPKDASDPAMNDVWKRLGVPDTAEPYKFDEVKFGNGDPIDADYATAWAAEAHKLKLTPAQAAEVAKWHVGFGDSREAAEATERTAALAAATASLDQRWGGQKDVNTFLAQKARQVLRLPESWLTPELDPEGYADRMDALRALGANLPDPRFLNGNSPNVGGGAMTREQAAARKQELFADQAWCKRWAEGDKAALDELHNINVVLAGPAPRY